MDAADVTDTARSLHAEMEAEPEEDENWLRSEAIQVFKQLRSLALQLNTGHDDDSGKNASIYKFTLYIVVEGLTPSIDILIKNFSEERNKQRPFFTFF